MEHFDGRMLIQYVQKEIASGTQSIIVPTDLARQANEGVLSEVRSLCKLSGVTIRGLDV
jgi:hypothetical protein